nr:hypothetical protein NG677_19735 [Methylobacterium sp. OTU13CASTA1]
MNEAHLHRTPAPAVVADVVDSCGWDMARERWGWLDHGTLSRLAKKGRRAAGRETPSGNHRNSAHRYLNKGWDGLLADRLDVPAAAEVLGLSASTLTRGNA